MTRSHPFLVLFLALIFASSGGLMAPSYAGQDPVPVTLDGDLPAGDVPLLRLTPDKIELVKLDRNAAHVMVGNPKHVLGVIETPRSVILIPRAPGASHLEITDAMGRVIYERSVIVAAPADHYVRVRKACAGAKGCEEYNIFYCPDMCHKVALPTDGAGTGASGSAGGGASAAAGSSGGGGSAGGETVNDGMSMQTDPNLGSNLGQAAMMP